MRKRTKFITRISILLLFLSVSSCNSIKMATKHYKITWLDHDNTILKVTKVAEGEIPTYGEIIPHYEDEYTVYYFHSWNTELLPAYNDATYKAQYIDNIDLFMYSNDHTACFFDGSNDTYLDDGVLHLPSTTHINGIVTSAIGGIGGSHKIQEIVIPSCYTKCYYEDSVFYQMPNLKKFTFQNNESFSFENGNLYLNNKSTLVYCLNVFEGTYQLKSSVTKIFSGAFFDCTNINNYDASLNPNFDTFNGILTNIQKTEIVSCPKRKTGEIAFPTTILSCYEGAFLSCSLITSVTINDGFETLNDYVFADCTNLSFVSIPSTLKTMGYYEFSHDILLTTLNYRGTMQEWKKIPKIKNTDKESYSWIGFSYIEHIVCSDGTIDV